jgi:hypothetical protein
MHQIFNIIGNWESRVQYSKKENLYRIIQLADGNQYLMGVASGGIHIQEKVIFSRI